MEKMRMRGATLPGNSTVEMKDMEIPKPGHGQVLIQTKATTICGSDIAVFTGNTWEKGRKAISPVWWQDMNPAV